MRWVLLLLLLAPSAGVAPRDATFACESGGSEDWPTVQRQLLRLLDGGKGNSLQEQLSRAASADRQQQPQDCLPGQIALRFLLLLTGPPVSPEDAQHLIGEDWRIVGDLGWPAVIRSGWPVFRLLRLLQRKVFDAAGGDEANGDEYPGVPGCNDSEEQFAAMLMRHVRQRRASRGESLLTTSAAYLAEVGIAGKGCPLSGAAAFLTAAWGRFPVYDAETEDMLRLAQPLVSQLGLAQLLLTRHALLDMLDDMASMYSAFLIDSGALYEDLRTADPADPPQIDYTRHMVNDRNALVTGGRVCSVPSLRTPLGYCNPFAPLGAPLSPLRRRGIRLDDTIRAFRGSTSRGGGSRSIHPQGPVVLFRLIGQELAVVGSRENEDLPVAGNIETKAVDCLAGEILSVLAIAPLPDFDIVVNFGDRPVIERHVDHAPGKMQWDRQEEEDAVPLFSLCSSSEFLDIPLALGCAQVQCQAQFGPRARRRSNSSSTSHQEANLWDLLTHWKPSKGLAAEQRQAASSGVFAARCYLFRMLASYGELLHYAPGHVQTSLFSRSERPRLRTFKLPRPRRRALPIGDFEAACTEAVDDAAQ